VTKHQVGTILLRFRLLLTACPEFGTPFANRPWGGQRCYEPMSSIDRGNAVSQLFMRVATLYFVTDVRLPGVSPTGIALSISSPRL
jgi:hypothetical protein